MSAPKLPPLPEPDVRDYGRAHDGFTQDKMHAYGLACYRQGLEQAAKVCDSVNNYDNPMTATDCADAIRALAKEITP